jgi:NAD(P)H-hydrate epimerase
MSRRIELLSVEEMGRADRMAIDSGVAGATLMEHAGRAVADAIVARWPRARAAVLCGPGNNGGDGFVAARHLVRRGWQVRLGLLGGVDKLQGEAAHHAGLWDGAVEPMSPELVAEADLVVDALFGAGLSRPLEGQPKACIAEARARAIPTVAVDTPSGVAGDSGEVLGEVAPDAALTVTFFRKKPGHLLLPGAAHCGEVVLADIGIPAHVLSEIRPKTFENDPFLWAHGWPWRTRGGHKYRYGHVLVLGGATTTGAARLGCRAALRVGAGLVSVAAPAAALPIYAAGQPSLITRPLEEAEGIDGLLADERLNTVLLGPGAGVTETTRARAEAVMDAARSAVLDADALTCFAGEPAEIAARVRAPTVLTPHAGEFRRLFPDLDGDKLTCTRQAAYALGATVVLKGSDSVIAAPDGRAAINANAPPELATAGAGDVLSGLIAGLLAQGLGGFEAACAGVWLHGQAAQGFGPGLIAEDLPDRVPAALQSLREIADRELRAE